MILLSRVAKFKTEIHEILVPYWRDTIMHLKLVGMLFLPDKSLFTSFFFFHCISQPNKILNGNYILTIVFLSPTPGQAFPCLISSLKWLSFVGNHLGFFPIVTLEWCFAWVTFLNGQTLYSYSAWLWGKHFSLNL